MRNRFLFWLLPVLMVLLPICFAGPSAADDYPSRISLAVSGGASMGAYEAGLIWGLVEVLRQADDTATWAMGGEPRSIEISSVAGASAGGINTLLVGMAWAVNPEEQGGFANRIDDNIFRDVWLAPDVNRLLPPEADSAQYLADDALLSRKDLVAVAGELRKKWRRPGSFRPGLRIPMGVTVTRVEPDTMVVSGVAINNQRFYIPFEMQTQADGHARFAFDPNDYPSLADPAMILMPWPAGESPFAVSDQQVEDALLTTSAFPIGFGRRRLTYCRRVLTVAAGETIGVAGDTAEALACPEGYELQEAEFADGGLFDNLPIGLARLLAESSRPHKETPLPVEYLYIDPDRQRYRMPVAPDLPACEGGNPPAACRELTHDIASETAVLGGAIGTARKYELYRELTSDNWRLNLSQLSQGVADLMDANQSGGNCDGALSYIDVQLSCSDRLRHAGQLLAASHRFRFVPISPPLSARNLMDARIAIECRPPSSELTQSLFDSECRIDRLRLRDDLAGVLADLSTQVGSDDKGLAEDIRRSARSIGADRLIQVTSRGGPITGTLLSAFGAFLDFKFREFDYYVGIYDAITLVSNNLCAGHQDPGQPDVRPQICHDRLSEKFYHLLGVGNHPKSRYAFALLARQEFGADGGLRFAYDPMPPEDRDIRIIHDGLMQTMLTVSQGGEPSGELVSTERAFFEHLNAEGFDPTPSPGGGTPLLALIMDDPAYWSSELVIRATSRLMYLEKAADVIYQAREPDPEKRDQAHTGLMGAAALGLQTATYKYPPFTFSPSTAPRSWFWRNLIPYEAAFDMVDGDILLFWQPTWSFAHVNLGIRTGLGFTGGLFKSNSDQGRENYGMIGLDLTRIQSMSIFSGWGLTPGLYHNWQRPETGDQSSFGAGVHVNLLENRLRIGFGARDLINHPGDTLFFNVGITDLPGLVYWLGQ